MRRDSIAQGRELVDALSRFCKSIEDIAARQSDAEDSRPGPDAVAATPSSDARVQLLSLTELVQHTLHVLAEILSEVEAPPKTGDH